MTLHCGSVPVVPPVAKLELIDASQLEAFACVGSSLCPLHGQVTCALWRRWFRLNSTAVEAVEEYTKADPRERESLREFLGSLGIKIS